MAEGTTIRIPARAASFYIGLAAILALGLVATRDADGQQLQLSPQLQTNMRFLHVGLTGGRVTATSSYSGRSFSSTSQSKDRQESLKVDMNGTAPSVDYQLTTDGFKVSVQLTAGNELHVRREPKEGSTAKAFELHQPPEGHVTVILGPEQTKLEAASLWHLLLDQPDLAKNELEPMLRLLRPGWPLVSQARAVEEALYKQVDASAKFDRNAWAAMVSQLGSDKYLEREEADRKLRELGQSIVPYLKNLSPSHLDAEQLYRIRAIARQYETEENEDNADTAAGWLSADPEIWYILLRRADSQQRVLARMQLERILGEPVEFDPAATGETLRTQLKRLRDQIDRRKQADAGSR